MMNKRGFHENLGKMFLNSIYTNNGPLVRELENQFARYHGVHHAIAVCNATMGLQVVAKAMGLTGEVIMPAFTFVATAHAMSWIGLKPVFCDVEETGNVSAKTVEPLISERTSAILGVHLLGEPADPLGLEDLAMKEGVQLFFDAAHAVGCSFGNLSVGGFGNAEVFSTHATKLLNTFEGGFITTNDPDLAEKCKLMRNFGFADYDTVVSEGINAKMSEAHAAMGLANLEVLDKLIERCRKNWFQYEEELKDIPGIRLWEPWRSKEGRRNHQYVVIDVPRGRNALLDYLHKCGMLARRYFWPGVHRMPPYIGAWDLPVTDELCYQTLFLPGGATLRQEGISTICSHIRDFQGSVT
jgi:dTDP-4-amino-4,6-dideoxygalactose transaminase